MLASPEFASIVATAGVAEDQCVLPLTSAALASLKVPVVLSCSVNPITDCAGSGVMAIDCNTGGLTVTVVLPATGPVGAPMTVAVMTAVPSVRVSASPAVTWTLATVGVAEDRR